MQLLSLLKELSLHPKNAEELKGLILQLAVQGKLTAKWREDNPNVEPASELLKRIEAEKQQLFKEKKIKKEAPLPPAGEDEMYYELPVGWVWCRFQNIITELKGGGTPSKQNHAYWNGDLPWASVKDLKDFRYLEKTKDFISEEGLNNSSANLIPINSLIICTRMGLGKIAISKIPVTINQDLKAVTLSHLVNIEFIYDQYKTLSIIGSGMTVAGIKQEELLAFLFALPPLEEQQAIVEVVNQLFAEVEKLEALTKKRISLKEDFVTSALRRLTETHNTAIEWNGLKDQLSTFFSEKNSVKKLREAILQLAVQGKLTAKWRANNPNIEPASELLKRIEAEKKQLIKEKKIKKEAPLPAITKDEVTYDLPKGWVWCRFQEVFDIRDGTHDSPKDSLDKVTYPLVTSKNFNNGEIDFDSARRISKEDYLKVIQRSQVHNGDILFSMIGGNIGNQVEVGEFTEYAIKNVALFKHYRYGLPAKGFLKVFSKYIAMSLQSEAAGGAQPFVSLKFFRNLVLGLPPKEEQKAIVEQVNSLMALCDELEQQIEISHTQVEQLMQSCLKEVFEIA